MFEYKLCESVISADGRDEHNSFGIALYIDGVYSRRIDDISFEREKVVGLIRLFNEEELDPVHFDQAVEDFLMYR